MDIDSGALTRVIDQLEERGYLRRARDSKDRRKVEIRLTPGGSAAIEVLIPVVVEILNTALVEFNGTEVRELQRLLMKLNASLLHLVPEKT